jgi:4-amino-4-deoxy-L-arabinose transferase-like glycosyltransferase
MNQFKNFTKKHTHYTKTNILIPFVVCLIFFLLNLFTLTDFPFVHSDETWLSGLTRTMLETGSPASTEYFFDLYERNPHALKILFHAVEIGWISLFGYSIQVIRMLSLLAGTAAIFILYQAVFKITKSLSAALFGMVLMAVDVQFIYASHTARQEIWLVLILLTGLNLLLKSFGSLNKISSGKWSFFSDSTAGFVLGLSFGFHPNGLIILFPILGYYIYYLFIDRKPVLKNFLVFIGIFGITTTFFLILSFIFNANFITDYAAYGETLGVLESPGSKLAGWLEFYKKLYYQVSGTYYTPNIRPQFFFYGLTLITALLTAIFKQDSRKRLSPLLIGFIGIQAAFIFIGRYGQPSVILNFPILVVIAAVTSTELLNGNRKSLIKFAGIACYILIILSSGLLSVIQIQEEITQNSAHDEYLNKISVEVPPYSTVLCNINAEPFFDYGKLYDWRNIGKLSETDTTFAQYIKERGIEYIIYPEEIDYIYQHRPLWNGIYGNVAPVYIEMQDFLDTQCEKVGVFSSRTYAMRIVRYQQEREWAVTLYRIFP